MTQRQNLASQIEPLELSANETNNQQLNFELYSSLINTSILLLNNRYYLHFPISHLNGPQVDLQLLFHFTSFNHAADLNNWIERMRLFPEYIQQTMNLMKEGQQQGITVPQVILNRVTTQIQNLLDSLQDPSASLYFQPFIQLNAAEDLRQQ
jgi:prolyl oligopeptidase